MKNCTVVCEMKSGRVQFATHVRAFGSSKEIVCVAGTGGVLIPRT